MILEVIITSANSDGTAHVAPMGVQESGDVVVVAPFRPSRTLDNLVRDRYAVMNLTDDVRVFAGAVTGRQHGPLCPATHVPVPRLREALAHVELEVRHIEEDTQRPRFVCGAIRREIHGPFRGFNRAQAAVLEAAILVSRLDRLPVEKVAREFEYLGIAVDKTAGEREREAWSWLADRIAAHLAAVGVRSAAS